MKRQRQKGEEEDVNEMINTSRREKSKSAKREVKIWTGDNERNCLTLRGKKSHVGARSGRLIGAGDMERASANSRSEEREMP
jgi:hypothetical protein